VLEPISADSNSPRAVPELAALTRTRMQAELDRLRTSSP
jgi:hypothetical protein